MSRDQLVTYSPTGLNLLFRNDLRLCGKCSRNRVGLIAERSERVLLTRKAKQIDGGVISPQKVKSSAHAAAGRYVLKVKDRAFHAADKILILSGNKARPKL